MGCQERSRPSIETICQLPVKGDFQLDLAITSVLAGNTRNPVRAGRCRTMAQIVGTTPFRGDEGADALGSAT
jgi:hypothetical protein